MMNLMTPKRQLAALIWAATVVIAAQLLPSIAQAHAGHDHASPSFAMASPDHIADQAKSAEAKRSSELTELASIDLYAVPTPATSAGCKGVCCGTGTACCGVVLLLGFEPALPDIRRARQAVDAGSSAPPGFDPDALRKPPRSFA
jgi:hypothetical protein